MRLNTRTGQGIRILIACARANGKIIPTSPLSHALDINPTSLVKLVWLLSKDGWLETARGKRGGIRLAMPANEIRVGDVVRTLERPVEGAAAAAQAAPEEPGSVSAVFDSAFDAFNAVLNAHTIAEFMGDRVSEEPSQIRDLEPSHRCKIECGDIA